MKYIQKEKVNSIGTINGSPRKIVKRSGEKGSPARAEAKKEVKKEGKPVSYTHLTLPTIYSV